MRDAIDVDEVACGPATGAVRSLLRLAASTRWFAPPIAGERSWIEAHVELVRVHVPGSFASHVEVTHELGGWPQFEALARRVQYPNRSAFDWKFGVLKPMVHRRADARGWSRAAHLKTFQGPEPARGDLLFALGDQPIWRAPPSRTDFSGLGTARAAASWYHGFALGDVTDAIEWQLVEGIDDLSGNPMLPLVRGYAVGQYPFVLDAAHVVVLRFADPS